MKKAVIRILCLLLGVNVFTACYGPYIDPELNSETELEAIQQELKELEQAQQLQEEEPEEEATPEQE